MEPGDEELIRAYTSHYLGFSYYRTSTHEYGQPFYGETGGDQGRPNPYLETTLWGRWMKSQRMGKYMTITESIMSAGIFRP